MALNFFRFKEANAEIARLASENEKLQKQVADFGSIESDNLAAVQAELADAKSKLEKANVDLAAATASVQSNAAKDAEIAALKEAAVKLEAGVEARASEKALAITQAQGQSKPVAVVADAKTPEQLLADFKAMPEGKEKSEFQRKNAGKLLQAERAAKK